MQPTAMMLFIFGEDILIRLKVQATELSNKYLIFLTYAWTERIDLADVKSQASYTLEYIC